MITSGAIIFSDTTYSVSSYTSSIETPIPFNSFYILATPFLSQNLFTELCIEQHYILFFISLEYPS